MYQYLIAFLDHVAWELGFVCKSRKSKSFRMRKVNPCFNKLSCHGTMTGLDGGGSCRKGSMTRDLNTMHQHQQTSAHG